MLETKLLLLFGICLAAVLINGLVIVKFYAAGSKGAVPVVVMPLTENMETPEFIVRNCVYKIAEKCPETFLKSLWSIRADMK